MTGQSKRISKINLNFNPHSYPQEQWITKYFNFS
ncbi:MAG: hypothetical protein ACI952_002438, partial [Flavobacteriales bacterium]